MSLFQPFFRVRLVQASAAAAYSFAQILLNQPFYRKAAMRNPVSDGLVRRIDALTSNICVVDPDGVIIASNQAWKAFAARNSPVGARPTDYAGFNYLDVCRRSAGPNSDEAPDLLEGLRAVLEGEQDIFEIEYPCHSPAERRWFRACVTPLWISPGIQSANTGAIVAHANITDRKLAEREYDRLASNWTPTAEL